MRIVSIEPEEGNVIQNGQHCRTLTMLVDGRLACNTEGEGWTMCEEICAPALIEEEALWSLEQRYKHTYTPVCEGKLIVADRWHVMNIMLKNEVFRINLLSRLSSRLEKCIRQNQDTLANGVREKIMDFVARSASTRNVPKKLTIKMTTLANIIGETRLNVSRTLHQMQEDGILEMGREQITILKL